MVGPSSKPASGAKVRAASAMVSSLTVAGSPSVTFILAMQMSVMRSTTLPTRTLSSGEYSPSQCAVGEAVLGGAECVRVLELIYVYANPNHQTLCPPTSAPCRPPSPPDRASKQGS